MSHRAKIAKWGNSAALRLPTDLLKEARLTIGTSVEIEVTAAGVLFKATDRRIRPTLEAMLGACSSLAPMPDDLDAWKSEPRSGGELL